MLECARQMQSPSALFLSPGFLFEYVIVDSMHCIDLGCFADAIGGIMYIELSSKLLHPSFAAGIKWINEQLVAFYKVNPGLSQLELTLSMIKPSDGSHPTLKSKAAACRHLADFAFFLARRHDRLAIVLDGHRQPYSADYRRCALQMTEAMVEYHNCCSRIPFVADTVRTSLAAFVQGYDQLRLLFRRGLPAEAHHSQVFGPRPKLHLVEHMYAKCLLFGSPRQFWCYGDEDFVGLIKRIAMQTRHPRSIEWVLLCKYRLYAALHSHVLGNL
jgi:hypothetical protein